MTALQEIAKALLKMNPQTRAPLERYPAMFDSPMGHDTPGTANRASPANPQNHIVGGSSPNTWILSWFAFCLLILN